MGRPSATRTGVIGFCEKASKKGEERELGMDAVLIPHKAVPIAAVAVSKCTLAVCSFTRRN